MPTGTNTPKHKEQVVQYKIVMYSICVHKPQLSATVHSGSSVACFCQQVCPVATYIEYRCMREQAMPIGHAKQLEAQCGHVLQLLLGPTAYQQYNDASLISHPELTVLQSSTLHDSVGTADSNITKMTEADDLADATAAPACDAYYMQAVVDSITGRALKASYDTFAWVKQHRNTFPLLADG